MKSVGRNIIGKEACTCRGGKTEYWLVTERTKVKGNPAGCIVNGESKPTSPAGAPRTKEIDGHKYSSFKN